MNIIAFNYLASYTRLTGTDHCWLKLGGSLSPHSCPRVVWVSLWRDTGLQTQSHKLLRDAWGSSGENDLWPPWLGNPPGSQREELALWGTGCNRCGEGGRPAGDAWSREGGRGCKGNLRPQRKAGVGELMRALVCVHGSMVLVWILWEVEWLRWQ